MWQDFRDCLTGMYDVLFPRRDQYTYLAEYLESGRFHIDKSVEAFNKGDYFCSEEHLLEYLEILAKDPEKNREAIAGARAFLAVCQIREMRYAAAEKILKADLADLVEQRGAGNPVTFSTIHTLASSLEMRGKTDEAVEILENLITNESRLFGKNTPGDPQYAMSLASALNTRGDVERANDVSRELFVELEKTRGKTHRWTQIARVQYAEILISNGYFREGEALLREALDLFPQVTGLAPHEIWNCRARLADSLARREHHEEAMVFLQETLADVERVNGSENAFCLSLRISIAERVRDCGRPHEAIVLHRGLSDTFGPILGQRHPFMLRNRDSLAYCLRDHGGAGEALELDRHTVKIREEILGKKEIATILTQINVAYSLHAMGASEKAESTMREAVASLADEFGESHRETLRAKVKLARLLPLPEKAEEVRQLITGTLEKQRLLSGNDSYESLITCEVLALFYFYTDEKDKSEQTYRNVLDVVAGKFADDHVSSLEFKSNLAMVLEQRGQFDEAESLRSNVYEIWRADLGHGSLPVVMACNALIPVLRIQNKTEPAIFHVQRELDRARERLGSLHGETIRLESNLAECLLDLDHGWEAVEQFRKTLELGITAYGKNSKQVLSLRNRLGQSLFNVGCFGEAVDTLAEYLPKYQQIFGRLHDETFACLQTLGNSYANIPQYGAAESVAHTLVAMARERYGEESRHALNYKRIQAHALIANAKPREGEDILTDVVKGESVLLADKPKERLQAMNELANCLINQQRQGKAIPVLEAIVDLHNQLGEAIDRREKVPTYDGLACSLFSEGKYQEALPYFQTLADWMEAEFGPENGEMLRTRINLALCLDKLGKYEESEPLLRQVLHDLESADFVDRENEKRRAVIILSDSLVYRTRYDQAEKILQDYLRELEDGREVWSSEILFVLIKLSDCLAASGKTEAATAVRRDITNREELRDKGQRKAETSRADFAAGKYAMIVFLLLTLFKTMSSCRANSPVPDVYDIVSRVRSANPDAVVRYGSSKITPDTTPREQTEVMQRMIREMHNAHNQNKPGPAPHQDSEGGSNAFRP